MDVQKLVLNFFQKVVFKNTNSNLISDDDNDRRTDMFPKTFFQIKGITKREDLLEKIVIPSDVCL